MGEGQQNVVINKEVNKILEALREKYGEKAPKLTFFIVTKRIEDRFG